MLTLKRGEYLYSVITFHNISLSHINSLYKNPIYLFKNLNISAISCPLQSIGLSTRNWGLYFFISSAIFAAVLVTSMSVVGSPIAWNPKAWYFRANKLSFWTSASHSLSSWYIFTYSVTFPFIALIF